MLKNWILILILIFLAIQNRNEFKRFQQVKNVKSDEMILIEGGEFLMGSSKSEIDSLVSLYGFPDEFIGSEFPEHKVKVSSFYIDKYEVTNTAFQRFLTHNPKWRKENIPDDLHNGKYLEHWAGNDYPKNEKYLPVYNVSWYASVAFCQWQDKRLPTEAEWEYVASLGGLYTYYPWGDTQPDSSKANFYNYHGKAVEVGSYSPNKWGVFDLAGNVWEFMLDEWDPDFYEFSPIVNPVNGQKYFSNSELITVKTRIVIRGGSWGGADVNVRVRFRDSHPPTGAGDHVGFRCAKDF